MLVDVGTSEELLLESFRSRRFSLFIGVDAKVSIWIDVLALNLWVWRVNRFNHNGRCSEPVMQQQVNVLMSQNAAFEAQLVGQQIIAQGFAEFHGALTIVLSGSQAPMWRMFVNPKGLGKLPVFSGREEHFHVWARSRTTCLMCAQMCMEF